MAPTAQLVATPVPETVPDTDTDELVLADVLVEEVSIDGMCGVY